MNLDLHLLIVDYYTCCQDSNRGAKAPYFGNWDICASMSSNWAHVVESTRLRLHYVDWREGIGLLFRSGFIEKQDPRTQPSNQAAMYFVNVQSVHRTIYMMRRLAKSPSSSGEDSRR